MHRAAKKQKPQWSGLLVLIGVASTFGAAFSFGYNIGVVNAMYQHIKNWCNITTIEVYGIQLDEDQLNVLLSMVISIFLVGGCVGSLVGAWFANRFGRRGAFVMSGFLFVVAAVLLFGSRLLHSIICLLLGRLVVGLASGLVTSTIPMYLAECAPIALRGTFGVLTAIGTCMGVVIGQVASLQKVLGSEEQWHIALSGYVILVIICFAPFRWFPESPKYLYIVRDRRDLAKKELQRLRGTNDPILIHDELTSMELEASTQSDTRSILSVLTDRKLLLPVILVCVLQGGQQLSGVNAVFYYSTQIFVSVGLSKEDAEMATLGAGCLNLFLSCFGPVIMQRCNRRPVILASCFFSGVFLVILSTIIANIDVMPWFPKACVATVLGYVFAFQIGLGPIPFFIGSELFEVAPRSAAMALGSFSSWSCNFFIGMTFLILAEALGALVFLPYAFVCFGMVLFLNKYLPETRDQHSTNIAIIMSHGFQSKPKEIP